MRQARPGGGGAAALAGFEVYPLPPLPTYQGGVAEKVGAGFQPGVYKITPILQTPLSNIAIYDNYTGGTRKIRGHLEGMGPQGEIEIGLCGRHTRRVQVPEARSSSWVFYLLSSGAREDSLCLPQIVRQVQSLVRFQAGRPTPKGEYQTERK